MLIDVSSEIYMISHLEWAIYHFVRAQITQNETASVEEMKQSWTELFMAAFMEESMVLA
jgi:hypothetical protein